MTSPSTKNRTKVRSIFITPDGDVEAVHNPVLDRIDLGQRLVQRASEIRFDHELQEWRAMLYDYPDIQMVNPSRATLVETEVQFLTAILRDKLTNEQFNNTNQNEIH